MEITLPLTLNQRDEELKSYLIQKLTKREDRWVRGPAREKHPKRSRKK
jgi:hypothetical protein